ncbi:hypothetical protein G163CM_35960 [Pseudocitrobacter corydidari]|uniref:Transposase n=1 Tax=Pseudocitrobacter corydidari TaxID=2891570 RepID=A0ABY3SAJ7_9ENTR|nr:hypothetical protein G163CM_35960 [Pseudocitrobacter corydidari]
MAFLRWCEKQRRMAAAPYPAYKRITSPTEWHEPVGPVSASATGQHSAHNSQHPHPPHNKIRYSLDVIDIQ